MAMEEERKSRENKNEQEKFKAFSSHFLAMSVNSS
jgi:hypothetical protein